MVDLQVVPFSIHSDDVCPAICKGKRCLHPTQKAINGRLQARPIDLPQQQRTAIRPGSPDFFAIVLCLLASFLRMRPRAAHVCFGVALVLGKGRLHQRRGSLKASRLLNMNHHQLFT